MTRIESAFYDLRCRGFDKAAIGKKYNTSKVLRAALSILEFFGARTFVRYYYKKQFKKLIPELNDHYLKAHFGLEAGSKEFDYLKTHNIFHNKKILFHSQKNEEKLKVFSRIFKLRENQWLKDCLPEDVQETIYKNPQEIDDHFLEKTEEILSLYENEEDKDFFIGLIKKFLIETPLFSLNTALLKLGLKWKSLGFLHDSETRNKRLHFLLHSREILEHEPWIKRYISPTALQTLKNASEPNEEASLEIHNWLCLLDLMDEEKIQKQHFFRLVDYVVSRSPSRALNEAALNEIQILIHWVDLKYIPISKDYNNLKEVIGILHFIKNRFSEEGLERFCLLFYEHPLYLDKNISFPQKFKFIIEACEDPTASVDSLFESERIKQSACLSQISLFYEESFQLWDKEIVNFLLSNIHPDVKCANMPLDKDPAYPLVCQELEKLQLFKTKLLPSDSEEARFRESLLDALKAEKDLPLPDSFYEKAELNFLGKEYQTCLQIYKTVPNAPSLDFKTIEDKLKALLPFARMNKEIVFLMNLFIHKIGERYCTEKNYTYQNDLKTFISCVCESISPIAAPIEAKTIENYESFIKKLLDLILSAAFSIDDLFLILKKSGIKYPDLHNENYSVYSRKLETLLQEFQLQAEIEKKDPAFFEAIIDRFLILGIRSFFKALLGDVDPASLKGLINALSIVEKKYEEGKDLRTGLIYLKAKYPNHIAHYFFERITNNTFLEFIQNDHFELKKLLVKSLNHFQEELKNSSYSDVKKTLSLNKSAYFPISFFPFFIDDIIYKVEQTRILLHTSKAKTGSDSSLSQYFLKNLSSMISILECAQGIKITGAIGRTLMTLALPPLLKLLVPFFSHKESYALIDIINLILPHLIQKHDFDALINYCSYVNSLVSPPKYHKPSPLKDSYYLTEEMKRKLALETTNMILYLYRQILAYEDVLPRFLLILKEEIKRNNLVD